MNFSLLRQLLVIATLTAPQFSVAAAKALTADTACDTLVAVAKDRHFVGDIAGTYYCESIDDFLGGAYFLMNLKFNREDAEKDFVGSNLVGWYAVRKSNHAVFEVDIGEGKVKKRIIPSRKAPMPNHTFHPTPTARLN